MKNVISLGLLLIAAGCRVDTSGAPCEVDAHCPTGQRCAAGRCEVGEGDGGTSLDAGRGSDGGTGVDAGPGLDAGPHGGCEEDCAAVLAAQNPAPAGCAEATCESGMCRFTAKDLDGDGEAAHLCSAGSLMVTTGTDCDDTLATVKSGSFVDCLVAADGGALFPGNMVQGACVAPTKSCGADGLFTECTGGTLPVVPRCESAEDFNCNGRADSDDCGCPTGMTRSCYPADGGLGAGVCVAGQETCQAIDAGVSAWSMCAGAITPMVEACNGRDDDCDGTVDEGTQVTCYVDADGDRRAVNATATMRCPDMSRPTFGNCPAGFVSTSSATSTTDCNDNNSALYQSLSVRSDADNDTYCSGGAVGECSGASPNAGKRLAASCASRDDDCDNNSGAYQNLSVRPDADGDTYCGGSATTECFGAGVPPGRRLAAGCADDCNDSNGSLQINRTIADDSDGDQYCTSGPRTSCESASGNFWSGRRLYSSCVSTADCRPGNPNFGGSCDEVQFESQQFGHCCCLGCGEPNPVQRSYNGSCPSGYKLSTCFYNKYSGMGSNVINGISGVSNFSCTMSQSCSGCDGTTASIIAVCTPCDTQACP